MMEPLEISSDSSDTIMFSPKEAVFQDENDSDVEALVNKYIAQNVTETGDKSTIEKNFKHQDISHDDLDLGVPLVKRLKQADDDHRKNSFSSSSSSQEGSTDDNEALQMLHEKYKINVHNANIKFSDKQADENIDPKKGATSKKLGRELQKQTKIEEKRQKKMELERQNNLQKELQKQTKIEEKRQKKMELERENQLKQALTAASKATKPEDFKKFVTVVIDENIANEVYSDEIISALQEMEVQSKFQSQLFSHTITWTRKTQRHLVDDDGKLVSSSGEQDEDHVLLIMNCKEFVEHINNSTLCGYVQSLKSVLTNKKITLIIYGLQSYTRFLKNQRQKEMRGQITGENAKPTTSKTIFQNFPKVTEKMIEYGFTELQLLCSCSHRLIDTASDLGLMVAQFTKAIAEIPLKLQRCEKFQQASWFVTGDNRDCVKVDKNGNGLNRLWNQVLTTFPLARLETAEAISTQFPTVSALMTAYENCPSTIEADLLLQDIPVRRAAGPLSSTRKIGPELSKKIHNFFTSTDGDSLL